jgi:hypothetical protein
MFGQTKKIVITSADTGDTAVVSDVSVGEGAMGAITSLISGDTAYVGLGATLGHLGMAYGAGLLVNYKLTGGFHINPLSQG